MPRPKPKKETPAEAGMESMTATMSFKDLARALAASADAPASGWAEDPEVM